MFPREIPVTGEGPVTAMNAEIEEVMKRDFRSKPVHVTWAMKDVAFLPSFLDTLWLDTFPDATVTKLDDAGHYLQEDAHERIVPELVRFVSALKGPSRVAAERDFDVVVFGATGVTGRRVAAYLAEQDAPLGRGGTRCREAGADPGRGRRRSAPATIIANVSDPASLAAMATRTRVVLNLCGPYTLHGQPVIEACVANGAHYVDLTGEIPFVRQMIDAYDARAQVEGVKVVQVCGFEALPPDLMVLLAAETAGERWEEGLAEADLEVSVEGPPGMPRPSDMISGGTFQSLAAAAGGDDASAVTDPAALITDPALAGEVRRRSPINVARGAPGMP